VAVGRACPTGWWAAGPGPTWAGPVGPESTPEPMRPGPTVSPSHVGRAAPEAPGPVGQQGTVGLPPAQPEPMPLGPRRPEPLGPRRPEPLGLRRPEPLGPRRAPVGPEQPPVPERGVGQDGELAPVPAPAGRRPERSEPLPGQSAPEQDRSMPVVRMRVDW
jgi:hypothetical protein